MSHFRAPYMPPYQQYSPPQYGGIAGNGYFYPSPAAQAYQPPQPAQTPQPPPMQLYAVNGVEGAKAYILPPSSSAYLIDADNPYLFFKETDAQGKASIKAFRIAEIPLEEVSKGKDIDTSEFATKAELEALKSKLAELTQSKGDTGNG